MVIAGAGAIEHGELVDLSNRYFGALPLKAPPGVNTGMDPAVFVGSDKRVKVSVGNIGVMINAATCC